MFLKRSVSSPSTCARFLCIGLGLFIAAPAFAEGDYARVAITFKRAPGAESCLGSDQVQTAVEARLGRQVFAESSVAELHLRGQVEPGSNSGWRVRLVLRSAGGQPLGERELTSDAQDCSSLDDALALTLAIMLDVPRDEVPPDPPPETVPSESTRPKASPLRIPPDTPPRREPWRLALDTGGVANHGTLPRVSFGVRARAWVVPPRFWRIGLTLTRYLELDEAVQEAGVTLLQQSVALGVCPLEVRSGKVSLFGCAEQRVGLMRVEGYGFDVNETENLTVISSDLLALGSLSLVGPLRLRVGVGLSFPWTRPRLYYQAPDGSAPPVFSAPFVNESLDVTFAVDLD